ncbi:MAG TPA: hypothetical protein VFC21_13120 [Bryobacteraceae bacterium]|nr:hypothetical protein [Bryobacteraceae bacterium]
MAYRLALVVSLIVGFADLPGFAQIGYPGGGIGYPGGGVGYPGGGGYPGGSGGGMGIPGIGGNRRGRSNMPTDTVSGKINRISTSQLVLDSDDGTRLQIALDRNTRYFNNSGGQGRYGDFDAGDQVSVDASRDNQNYMRGLRVSMIQKGSAGTQTSSSDSPRASSNASSSSDDDDPDRPRLKRNPTSSGSSSSSDSPKAQITSGDSNTVADNRPSTVAAPRPAPRESDDPGPPVLKRNAPARVDNTPPAGAEPGANDGVSTAQSIAERYKHGIPELSAPPARAVSPAAQTNTPEPQPRLSASARPSITAEETNGATRLPGAPVVGPASPSTSSNERQPSSAGGVFAGPRSNDPVIQGARDAAAQFTESLPNYIVKQFTTRYQTDAAHGNRTSWQALDVVTADVVCENGKESYKNIMVNGKTPKDDVEKTGSWSTGEFATVLQGILAPYTDADFHNKRSTTINNHPAFRYDYTVDQPKSGWHVYASSSSYVPGYQGSIWIDKDNFRVLRIEMSAVNMPKSFDLDAVESAVDYDYVLIADQKFLLPTHSEALSCERGTAYCTRNVIDFRNYKKFGADTSITFEK